MLARSGTAGAAGRRLRELDTATLFADFFREVTDGELDEPQRAALQQALAAGPRCPWRGG